MSVDPYDTKWPPDEHKIDLYWQIILLLDITNIFTETFLEVMWYNTPYSYSLL